jgi:hypothetical protein
MRLTAILSFFLVLVFINGCSSPKKKNTLTGPDVLRMINHYETDSLRAVMDKAFIMDFDNISFQGNAKTFLEEIMPSAKAVEAYYEIVEAKKPDNGNFQYTVKDHSAFDKYFQLEPPKLLLSIIINDSNRFEKIYIDSLSGYRQYDEQLGQKFASFDTWLKEKYPDDRLRDLLDDPNGKMIERLKEFSSQ